MNLGTGNRPFLLLFFNSRLRATICQAVRMSAFENTKGPVSTRCCLLLRPTPAIQIAISGRPPSYQLGGPARRSLTRHGQADLAAESRKAWIVLVAQDEGVEENVLD